MNFLDARNSTSAPAPEPSSSVTISPAVRGGRAVVSSTCDQATDRPTSPASTPRSDSDQRLERLLLRRHDALERRVAGLARLVGHRQHDRQRRADDLGRALVVALDPDLVALRLHDRGQRDLRQAEALGQHRRHDAQPDASVEAIPQTTRSAPASALIFSIALASTSEVATVVGAGDRVVDDVDAGVGTHLQRLAHRVDRLLGADGQRGDGDLLALALLPELQRLLDGVLVELGQQAVDADAVDGVVVLELPVGRRVGTYFTQTTMFMVVWPRGPSCGTRMCS